MAEYGRVGTASDYMRNEELLRPQSATRTSRVTKKISMTTVFDFGPGPYTVDDIREFAKEIDDFPTGAKVSIEHSNSQHEGEWLKITVIEG